MIVEKAIQSDIDKLVDMRIAYLREDNGHLDASDEKEIMTRLPDYFKTHLNDDLFCFIVRHNDDIIACAFLLVIIKPMSSAFINGKTGTVFNVYTKPYYRHQGYGKMLVGELIEEAKRLELSTVELKSTDAGYSLYKSTGFEDDNSKYHLMKWKNQSL